MAVPIKIPKLGMSMNAGTLVEWYAEEGALVQAGEPLFVVATDKVDNDVDSPATGRLRITGEIDTEYDVGAEIGFIEDAV